MRYGSYLKLTAMTRKKNIRGGDQKKKKRRRRRRRRKTTVTTREMTFLGHERFV